MGASFRYGAFNTEGARALLRYLTGPGRLRVVSFPLEDRREMRERVKSGARTKKSERGGEGLSLLSLEVRFSTISWRKRGDYSQSRAGRLLYYIGGVYERVGFHINTPEAM